MFGYFDFAVSQAIAESIEMARFFRFADGGGPRGSGRSAGARARRKWKRARASGRRS